MRKGYLIVGTGKTGKSVIEYLNKEGIEGIYLYDDDFQNSLKLLKEYSSSLKVIKELKDIENSNVEFVVPSPGVPPCHPVMKLCLEKKIKILSDVQLFSERFNGLIVAVTGTNGKTTVASMIDSILRHTNVKTFLGGNIGVPVIEGLYSNYDVAVLELSSFQLFYSPGLSVDIGILTNVAQDHLDWHGSFKSYLSAKTEWLKRVKRARIFFIDDEVVGTNFRIKNGKDYSVSTTVLVEKGAFIDDESSIITKVGGKEEALDTRKFNFYGNFNYINAGFSLVACRLLGIPTEKIAEALTKFKVPEGRLSIVGKSGKIRFFDDSKSTNPHATLNALLSMEGKCVLMIGGLNKSLSFKYLKKIIDEKCSAVVFFGKDGEKIRQEIQPEIPSEYSQTFKEAFNRAVFYAFRLGSDILLSPGCASFDEFKGYVHRSRVFRELVKNLLEKGYGREI